MKILKVGLLAIFLMCFTTGARSQNVLQIKGSDTLINIVQRLSEVYMEKNSGTYIAITGGGSGTGIAALINKRCDIANASRLMKSKEIEMARDRGVSINRIIIARDGLSVIVNGDNGVTQLTKDEIGAIFRGEIKEWSEVGGNDMPITLYGRQSNSGTFMFFQEHILRADYSQKMNRMNGNAQIMEAIKFDKSGIGYVGVAYIREAKGVNVVSVAHKKGEEYIHPLDVENYHIVRPLNQYIPGNISDSVRNFLMFELSEEGQRIVEEEGLFPISEEDRSFNAKIGL